MIFTSFYRDYLRNARRLPTLYLRQFFEIRARDDVERIMRTPKRDLRRRKLRDVKQFLEILKEANNKNTKSFEAILELAYGRTGKLRWELLEPILTDPNSPPPEPLIPAMPHRRPPVYSPELTRLLMTPSPSMKRPWSPAEFTTPRNMPPRANPAHADAQLLGPFSLRRTHNLRWRWFQTEIRRVLPPLEVQLGGVDALGRVAGRQCDVRAVELEAVRTEGAPGSAGLRAMGMQGAGVVQGVLDVVGGRATTRPPLTRRERATATREDVEAATSVEGHPSRWVRRRHRVLLASMPQLVYVGGIKVLRDNAKQKNPFVVTTSPLAMGGDGRVPDADSTSLAWIGDINERMLQNGNGNKADNGKRKGSRQ